MTRPVGARYRRAMRMPGSLLRRVRELPPTVADGLLAALLTVIALPMLFLPSENFERLFATSFRDPAPLGVLLTLCQTVPLTWRRRAPYAVLAVTTAAAIVHLALGFKPTFAEAAMVVSLYTVAAHRPRRQALTAAAAFAAAMVGYGVIAEARYPSPFEDSLQAWVLTFIQFAAAFFLGDLQKRRLAYMAKLEALNTQLATEQELRSRWAVAEERGRIARELHDVVAHSVSVMVVQAGAARRTLGRQPRPGGGRPRPDRVDRPPGPGRDAPPPRAAARRRPGGRRRPRPPAEPGAPGLAGRGRPRGRPAGRGDGRGRAAAAAGRGRPVGLPDRAGGADQLAQARRPGPGQGPDLLRP